MGKTGARIRMTKGYKGVKGSLRGKLASRFEFYIVELDNGLHIVVGPSGFEPVQD